MPESNLCRLCVNLSRKYVTLCDAYGQRNQVYDITLKYFHPMFLNVEQAGEEANQLTVLCLECWHCIMGFYKFQESIILNQTKLLEGRSEMSSNTKEHAVISSNTNEHSNNPNGLENDGLASVPLPDIELMDIYSDTPFNSDHPLKVWDRKNYITTTFSHWKYTEESTIKSEDDSSKEDDDDCDGIEDDDDPIGYFTAGHVNADDMLGSSSHQETINIDCSSSEKDEMEYDNNSVEIELKKLFRESEDNVNLSHKPATGGEVTLLKRKRKTTLELDAFISKWKPQLECKLCHQFEPTFARLQYHFRLNHPKDECHIICCNLKLKTRFTIKNHIRYHHRTKTTLLKKKRVRNLDFKTTLPLDRFIEHYERVLKCGVCDEERVNFGLLETHFFESHPQEQCHIVCCRRRLKNRPQIEEHIRVHLNHTLFQCKLCQMRQVTRVGLQSHMIQRHGVDLKDVLPHKTVICENTLGGRITYKHLDAVIAEWRPQLECHACSEPFSTFTLLQTHFQRKHPQGPHCYIECCGRKLLQHRQVEDHILLHRNPMAFKCQQCNERFLSTSSLYRHSRLQHPLLDDEGDDEIQTSKVVLRKSLHTIDNIIAQWKPKLSCDLCQESEPSFTLLQKHFRWKHPQDIFYIVCCGRKFCSRFQLRKHQMQVHDGTAI